MAWASSRATWRGTEDLTPADVDAAAAAMERWLAAVRRVVRAVARLPFYGRVAVVDDPGGPRRVVVSRPLVRLYVESHNTRRLKALDTALQLESLTVQRDDRSQRIRDLGSSVGQFRSARLTQRVRDRVTTFLAPFVLFVVGPAVILGGVDAEDVRKAFVLVVLLISLPVYFLLVRRLTIRRGFVPKRALWSGGSTVESVAADGTVATRQWVDFPCTDVYRLEAELFSALRLELAPERPLDVSTSMDVAGWLVVVGMAAGTVTLAVTSAPLGWVLLVAAATVVVTVQHVIDVAGHRRLRADRLARYAAPPF